VDGWHRVCAAAELPPGKLRAARVGERDLVVCATADGVHALDDLCTHAEARMSEGRLRGHRLVCPLHGAGFDCRSGAALSPPARIPLRRHEARVNADGDVEVRIVS
jgi:3-phenylpropionate/trans-cinnamate dioxygenase ferredoxin subunit